MTRTDLPPDPLPDSLADLILRPAGPTDAVAVAAVHLAARRAAPMPPPARSDDDVRRHLADRLGRDETWVAELDGSVVGYLRLTATWLDDLYVDPVHAGQGIGSALLDLAKAVRPGGFGLWVFAVNAPARAFYARHGLVEVEHTDGADNEEREPDVALRWAPGTARAGLGPRPGVGAACHDRDPTVT